MAITAFRATRIRNGLSEVIGDFASASEAAQKATGPKTVSADCIRRLESGLDWSVEFTEFVDGKYQTGAFFVITALEDAE